MDRNQHLIWLDSRRQSLHLHPCHLMAFASALRMPTRGQPHIPGTNFP